MDRTRVPPRRPSRRQAGRGYEPMSRTHRRRGAPPRERWQRTGAGAACSGSSPSASSGSVAPCASVVAASLDQAAAGHDAGVGPAHRLPPDGPRRGHPGAAVPAVRLLHDGDRQDLPQQPPGPGVLERTEAARRGLPVRPGRGLPGTAERRRGRRRLLRRRADDRGDRQACRAAGAPRGLGPAVLPRRRLLPAAPAVQRAAPLLGPVRSAADPAAAEPGPRQGLATDGDPHDARAARLRRLPGPAAAGPGADVRGAGPAPAARLPRGGELRRRADRAAARRTRAAGARRRHDRRAVGGSRLEARRAGQLLQDDELRDRRPRAADRRGARRQGERSFVRPPGRVRRRPSEPLRARRPAPSRRARGHQFRAAAGGSEPGVEDRGLHPVPARGCLGRAGRRRVHGSIDPHGSLPLCRVAAVETRGRGAAARGSAARRSTARRARAVRPRHRSAGDDQRRRPRRERRRRAGLSAGATGSGCARPVPRAAAAGPASPRSGRQFRGCPARADRSPPS